MGTAVSHTVSTMHLLILFTLASAASAAPQIVPYVHDEVAAEPYIHQEVEAEPYVHLEPEISPLALGIVRPGQAAPSYAPTGPVGYAAGAWTGGCYNNLGAGVPCRKMTLSWRWWQRPGQSYIKYWPWYSKVIGL